MAQDNGVDDGSTVVRENQETQEPKPDSPPLVEEACRQLEGSAAGKVSVSEHSQKDRFVKFGKGGLIKFRSRQDFIAKCPALFPSEARQQQPTSSRATSVMDEPPFWEPDVPMKPKWETDPYCTNAWEQDAKRKKLWAETADLQDELIVIKEEIEELKKKWEPRRVLMRRRSQRSNDPRRNEARKTNQAEDLQQKEREEQARREQEREREQDDVRLHQLEDRKHQIEVELIEHGAKLVTIAHDAKEAMEKKWEEDCRPDLVEKRERKKAEEAEKIRVMLEDCNPFHHLASRGPEKLVGDAVNEQERPGFLPWPQDSADGPEPMVATHDVPVTENNNLKNLKVPEWFRQLDAEKAIPLTKRTPKERYQELVNRWADLEAESRRADAGKTKPVWDKNYHDEHPDWPTETQRQGGWWRCRSGDDASKMERECTACHSAQSATARGKKPAAATATVTAKEKYERFSAIIEVYTRREMELDKQAALARIYAEEEAAKDQAKLRELSRNVDWRAYGYDSTEDYTSNQSQAGPSQAGK
ncbi:hypothetical protein P8C59_001325 [Phyllachora maydis]|uniref:Uncharacterized protein n=1 Tax=Phyllachora maydis TaxID=1825666 RepID=A0AAD9HY66_9PEZI|nr:hypothetical protein P8C59_001325 [Phyllachora maydis]